MREDLSYLTLHHIELLHFVLCFLIYCFNLINKRLFLWFSLSLSLLFCKEEKVFVLTCFDYFLLRFCLSMMLIHKRKAYFFLSFSLPTCDTMYRDCFNVLLSLEEFYDEKFKGDQSGICVSTSSISIPVVETPFYCQRIAIEITNI